MRNYLFIHLIMSIVLISGQMAFASCWKAKIMGEREDSRPKVLIGEGLYAQTLIYPPIPPADKCIIQLVSSDKTKRLTTDIRQTSNEDQEWLLLVNPHGPDHMGETTCTLSWSLSSAFSLTDFDDNVLVANMNKTTSYPVSSNVDEYLRFKIKYQKTPFDISALIRNLQIISGMLSSTVEDVNCDKKIDLADTIFLIQQISE